MAVPTLPQAGDEITATWGQDVAGILAKLLDPRFIQRGTANVNMGGSGAANQPVTFPTPFVNPPVVLVDRVTGTGTSPKVHLFASGVTATGFSLAGATGDGTTSANSIAGSWLAIDPAFLAS